MNEQQPDMAEVRSWPTEQRLKFLSQRLWIPHRVADLCLEEWEDWFALTPGEEMPGMTLYGHTGTGKSTLVRYLSAQHPRQDGYGQDSATIEMLHFMCPKTADITELYRRMLQTLGAPYLENENPSVIKSRVKHVLEVTKTRLIAFDDIHNFLAASPKRLLLAMNEIKNLTEELHLCVLLIGTYRAKYVLDYATELHRRYPPKELPRWVDPEEEDYRRFLADFEAILPLREASNLSGKRFSAFLQQHCEGFRHNIVDLIKRSTKYALKQ